MRKSGKILLMTSVICLLVATGITQINWQGDYQQGLSLAKLQHKPLLLYFYSPGSEKCTEFESSVLNTADVNNFLNANFINVKVDANTNAGLAAKFAVVRLPVIIVLDANENELLRLLAFSTPEHFVKVLSAIIQPIASPTPAEQLLPSPFLKLNQITAEKINSRVSVQGKIVNALSPTSPKAPYSYYITDGTETIRVVIWEDIFQQIKGRERFKVGAEVLVKGKVKEFYNKLEIHLEGPEDIKLTSELAAPLIQSPTPPAPAISPLPVAALPTTAGNIVPIAQLNNSMLNKTVTVRGKVVNIRPSWKPTAPNSIFLEDESGSSIRVVYWPDVEKRLTSAQRPVIDALMLVTGILDEYQGNLQIKVNAPENISVEKAVPLPQVGPGVIPIRSITRQLIGQRVTIAGKITRTFSVRGGTLLTVTDDSGSITVPLWDNLAEKLPQRDKVKEGAKVTISAIVSFYERRQEIQLQLNSPDDIKSIE